MAESDMLPKLEYNPVCTHKGMITILRSCDWFWISICVYWTISICLTLYWLTLCHMCRHLAAFCSCGKNGSEHALVMLCSLTDPAWSGTQENAHIWMHTQTPCLVLPDAAKLRMTGVRKTALPKSVNQVNRIPTYALQSMLGHCHQCIGTLWPTRVHIHCSFLPPSYLQYSNSACATCDSTFI